MSAAMPTMMPVPMKDWTMPPAFGSSGPAGSLVKKFTESACQPRLTTYTAMITSGISAMTPQSQMNDVNAVSFAARDRETPNGRVLVSAIIGAVSLHASGRLQRGSLRGDLGVAAREDPLGPPDEEPRHHCHEERHRHEDECERHQCRTVDVARRLTELARDHRRDRRGLPEQRQPDVPPAPDHHRDRDGLPQCAAEAEDARAHDAALRVREDRHT